MCSLYSQQFRAQAAVSLNIFKLQRHVKLTAPAGGTEAICYRLCVPGGVCAAAKALEQLWLRCSRP